MNKFFITLAAISLLFTGTLSGQTIRIEGGAAGSRFSMSKGSQSLHSDIKLGYRIGAAIEFKLFPMVYLATGANVSNGGGRFAVLDKYFDSFTNGSMGHTQGLNEYLGGLKLFSAPSISTTSVSLPLSLGVRFKPAGILGVSVEAGPYLSYDLKTSLNWGSYSADLTNIHKDSFGLIKYNRLSYGIGASATVELTRFYLRAGFEYGLSNRLNLETSEQQLHKLTQVAKEKLPPTLAQLIADDADFIKDVQESLKAWTEAKARAMQVYVMLGFRI